jgi:hypothetical protein
LVTWNTNRNISAKEPVRYLKERVERAALGEEQIKDRLATHLVPFDVLNVGGYASITDPVQRAAQIRSDYERFLGARATLVAEAMGKLCDGHDWRGRR